MKATVEVPLFGRRGSGLFAVIDAVDVDLVFKYRWHGQLGRTGPTYACTAIWTGSGSRHRGMHNLITGVIGVDHINGDALDNRRANLRPANKSQNAANKRKVRSGTLSVYKGVTWHARLGNWQAQIKVKGRNLYLGLFTTEADAARAYDAAAREQFDEFAAVNFPAHRERSA